MHIIELEQYLRERDIKLLERRISQLITNSPRGAVGEIKTCFSEYLKKYHKKEFARHD